MVQASLNATATCASQPRSVRSVDDRVSVPVATCGGWVLAQIHDPDPRVGTSYRFPPSADAFLSRQSLVPDPAFVAAVRTALESLRPATTGTGERHFKPAKYSVSQLRRRRPARLAACRDSEPASGATHRAAGYRVERAESGMG